MYSGINYQLYQGNCLDILQSLSAYSVDLIFADPPYFLSNDGYSVSGGQRTSVNKGQWDKSAGLYEDHDFHLAWLSECKRVLKESGSIWISGTYHCIFSIGFALQRLGYRILNTITWYKPGASPNLACRMFTHSTELLIWASPSQARPLPHKFNYSLLKTENEDKQVRDCWIINRPLKPEIEFGKHPCQKPLALLERVILASSEPGDVVLDPFTGSGSTGVAAIALGRQFIGIDQDPIYLQIAHKRLEKELYMGNSQSEIDPIVASLVPVAEQTTLTQELANATAAVETIKGYRCESVQDQEFLGSVLRQVVDAFDRIDVRRQAITSHLLAAKRGVDQLFKPILSALETGEQILREKIVQGEAARLARNDLLLSQGQVAIQQGQVDLAKASFGQIDSSKPNGISFRYGWEPSLENIDQVPKEFLTVNWAAVKEHISKFRHDSSPPEIPGLSFRRLITTVLKGDKP